MLRLDVSRQMLTPCFPVILHALGTVSVVLPVRASHLPRCSTRETVNTFTVTACSLFYLFGHLTLIRDLSVWPTVGSMKKSTGAHAKLDNISKKRG